MMRTGLAVAAAPDFTFASFAIALCHDVFILEVRVLKFDCRAFVACLQAMTRAAKRDKCTGVRYASANSVM